jgi:hypothetical protein
MIEKNTILDFKNEIKRSFYELEKEIADKEQWLNELHEKRAILGKIFDALESIVGTDDRQQKEPSPITERAYVGTDDRQQKEPSPITKRAYVGTDDRQQKEPSPITERAY